MLTNLHGPPGPPWPPHFQDFHIFTDWLEQAKLDIIHRCQLHWWTSCNPEKVQIRRIFFYFSVLKQLWFHNLIFFSPNTKKIRPKQLLLLFLYLLFSICQGQITNNNIFGSPCKLTRYFNGLCRLALKSVREKCIVFYSYNPHIIY